MRRGGRVRGDGHYFATPFAVLFAVGYLYVAFLVVQEQIVRRRDVASSAPVVGWSDARPSEAAVVGAWSRQSTKERHLGDLAV